jgi:putative glutamine amidotransferase
MVKKVYVVGGDTYYANWIKDHELVDNLDDANIILFTGGEDVDPSIYGKEKHPRTYSNIERDLAEKEIFEKIKPNQLALGICRGSQLLTALNGGILVQDCTNHATLGTHLITNGEYMFDITSTHHQMMYPFNLNYNDYDILYWTSMRLSDYYDGDGIGRVPKEPEVVYYHINGKPKSLAIQGHPEIMREDAPAIEILNKILTSCVAR